MKDNYKDKSIAKLYCLIWYKTANIIANSPSILVFLSYVISAVLKVQSKVSLYIYSFISEEIKTDSLIYRNLHGLYVTLAQTGLLYRRECWKEVSQDLACRYHFGIGLLLLRKTLEKTQSERAAIGIISRSYRWISQRFTAKLT